MYINVPYIRVLLPDTHHLSPFGHCHLQNQFLSYSICLSVRQMIIVKFLVVLFYWLKNCIKNEPTALIFFKSHSLNLGTLRFKRLHNELLSVQDGPQSLRNYVSLF